MPELGLPIKSMYCCPAVPRAWSRRQPLKSRWLQVLRGADQNYRTVLIMTVALPQASLGTFNPINGLSGIVPATIHASNANHSNSIVG